MLTVQEFKKIQVSLEKLYPGVAGGVLPDLTRLGLAARDGLMNELEVASFKAWVFSNCEDV